MDASRKLQICFINKGLLSILSKTITKVNFSLSLFQTMTLLFILLILRTSKGFVKCLKTPYQNDLIKNVYGRMCLWQSMSKPCSEWLIVKCQLARKGQLLKENLKFNSLTVLKEQMHTTMHIVIVIKKGWQNFRNLLSH